MAGNIVLMEFNSQKNWKNAASLGAATISSQAFEEKITLAAVLDSEFANQENESGWIPTTKKKGPSRID